MQTISKAVQQIVEARSGGVCEVAAIGCTGEATQMHHRRPKGMGGDKRPATNAPGNLLHVCYACHRMIEDNRLDAALHGWLLHSEQSPADEICTYRSFDGTILHDDGTITYRKGNDDE